MDQKSFYHERANKMNDKRIHLFIDDESIISKSGVQRVLGQPQKNPSPVIAYDRPWESPWIYAWGSVLEDPETDRLKMWYETMGYKENIYIIRTCYAESYDGINWDKPALGVYSFCGSNKTNIVNIAGSQHWDPKNDNPEGKKALNDACVEYFGRSTPIYEHVWHFDASNVVIDHNEKDPQKKYKYLACMWRKDMDGKGSHNLMTSPDGINWNAPPVKVLEGISDASKVVWDPLRMKWVLTYLGSRKHDDGFSAREFRMSDSNDLIQWSSPMTPFELDEYDEHGKRIQCHFMLPFVYGDRYIALLSMIHSTEGWCQTFLAYSTDGINYKRILRDSPFIPLGSEGSFDADSAEACVGAPIIKGDEMYIYYCGRARRHWMPIANTGAIGLARIKSGRFAGLTHGGWFSPLSGEGFKNDGRILTKPVEVSGCNLYVNARSRSIGGSAGKIFAELLDQNMKVIPGYSFDDCDAFHGDSIKGLITWKNKKIDETLAGEKVMVRFKFNMATIYSYAFL